jgi:hypothetical protein
VTLVRLLWFLVRLRVVFAPHCARYGRFDHRIARHLIFLRDFLITCLTFVGHAVSLSMRLRLSTMRLIHAVGKLTILGVST